MLLNLINALITDVHALVTHQSATSEIADAATTVEAVMSLVPGSVASDANLVATAVNAVLDIAKAVVPASNVTATAALNGAAEVVAAVETPAV